MIDVPKKKTHEVLREKYEHHLLAKNKEIKDLKTQITKLKQIKKDKSLKIQHLKSRVKELESELTNESISHESQRKHWETVSSQHDIHMKTMKQQADQLRSVIHGYQKEIVEAQSKVSKMNDQNKALRVDINKFSDTLEKDELLKKLEKDIEFLKNENKTLSENNKRFGGKNTMKLKQIIYQKQKEIEKLHSDAIDCRRRNQAIIQNYEDEIQKLQNSYHEKLEFWKDAETACFDYKKDINSLTKQLQESKKENKDINEELEKLKTINQQNEKDTIPIQNNISELKTKASQMCNKVKILTEKQNTIQEKCESLHTENDRLRMQMRKTLSDWNVKDEKCKILLESNMELKREKKQNVKKLKEQDRDIKTSKATIKTMLKQIDQLQFLNDSHSQKNQILQKEKENLETIMNELKTMRKIKENQTNNEDLSKNQKDLSSLNKSLITQFHTLKLEKDEIELKLKSCVQQNIDLQKNLKEFEERNESVSKKMETLKNEDEANRILKQHYETLTLEFENVKKSESDVLNKLQELESQHEKLKLEMITETEMKIKHEEKLTSMKEEYKQKEEENLSFIKEKNQFENEKKDLQHDIRALISERKKWVEENNQLVHQLSVLKENLEEMKKEKQMLKAQHDQDNIKILEYQNTNYLLRKDDNYTENLEIELNKTKINLEILSKEYYNLKNKYDSIVGQKSSLENLLNELTKEYENGSRQKSIEIIENNEDMILSSNSEMKDIINMMSTEIDILIDENEKLNSLLSLVYIQLSFTLNENEIVVEKLDDVQMEYKELSLNLIREKQKRIDHEDEFIVLTCMLQSMEERLDIENQTEKENINIIQELKNEIKIQTTVQKQDEKLEEALAKLSKTKNSLRTINNQLEFHGKIQGQDSNHSNPSGFTENELEEMANGRILELEKTVTDLVEHRNIKQRIKLHAELKKKLDKALQENETLKHRVEVLTRHSDQNPLVKSKEKMKERANHKNKNPLQNAMKKKNMKENSTINNNQNKENVSMEWMRTEANKSLMTDVQKLQLSNSNENSYFSIHRI